jgi:hypothetical protein
MTNSVAINQSRAPDAPAIDPKPMGDLVAEFAKAQGEALQQNIDKLNEFQNSTANNTLANISQKLVQTGGEAGQQVANMVSQIQQNAAKEMAKFAQALPAIQSGLDVSNNMMFELTNQMDAAIGESDEYKYYNE